MRKMIWQEILHTKEENDGKVPAEFRIEQPDKRLRYKDGWIQQPVDPDPQMFNVVFSLLKEGKTAAAYHEADRIFFNAVETDLYEEIIKTDIHENRFLLEKQTTAGFIKAILKTTIYPEAVQFAMIFTKEIPELLNNDISSLIETYAETKQFSFRALMALKQLPNSNELIFRTAQNTEGDAKARAIWALKPDNDEIRTWLLYHGNIMRESYINDHRSYDQTAVDICQKVNFKKMLDNTSTSIEDIIQIGHILLAFSGGEPVLLKRCYSQEQQERDMLEQTSLVPVNFTAWCQLVQKYFRRIADTYSQKITNDIANFLLVMASPDFYAHRMQDIYDLCRNYLAKPDNAPYLKTWMNSHKNEIEEFCGEDLFLN